MASLTKIKGVFHVRVRRKGHRAICKSFSYKADAIKWAAETERALQLGTLFEQDSTLGELLDRYAEQVSSKKKSAPDEATRIEKLKRSWLSGVYVSKLQASHLSQFRDELLKRVSPSTCLRDLALLSHVFTIAMKEWNYNLPSNPVTKIRKPSPNKPRDRRLEGNEQEQLLAELNTSGNIWAVPLVQFAIETAMRRGELLALRWEHVHMDKRYVHLPDTKNGTSRNVPLSATALAVLQSLPRDISGRVFPVHFEALKSLWQRATKRACIVDLNFHDLRHEATTRLFEKSLNVMEVASITGHKDLRMLQRYTHLRAEDLAKKLG